jgi:hypothetical protein
MKIDLIRADMIKNKEVARTSNGLWLSTSSCTELLHPPFTMYTTSAATNLNPDGDQQYGHALEIWKQFDVATQARLFRDQVIHAKDAQSLVLEWGKYVAESQARAEAKSIAIYFEEQARAALAAKQQVANEEAARKEAKRQTFAAKEAAKKATVREEAADREQAARLRRPGRKQGGKQPGRK